MQVAELFAKMSLDMSGFEKSLEQAKSKLDTVGQKMKSIGQSMSLAVTAPLVGAMGASFKLASDMDESINKVNVAFGESAGVIKEWADTTLQAYGIAKGSALDMAALFGDMSTSMGLSTKEAAEMSKSLVGLSGDLASFKNIGIDQAETALKGIFTGETESLKELGIVMTQTNLDAFAMANGFGKTVQEMTQAEQVQLRYAYVMNATKNAQGDFARTNGGAANQMRIFSESMKELGATIGTNLLPVITPIITKLNEWVQKFGELDTGTQRVILVIAGIAAAIGPVLLIIGTIASALGSIIAIAPAVGAAFTIMLGPVGLIVLGIAALIAIIVLVIKHFDDIKAAAQAVADKIVEIFAKFGEWVLAQFEKVSEWWEEKKKWWKDLWASLQKSLKAQLDAIKGLWDSFKKGLLSIVTSIWDSIIGKFKGFFTAIMTATMALTNGMAEKWQSFKDFMASIWEGITDIFFAFINVIIKFVNKLIKILNSINFEIPDWVPGFEGKEFKLDLKEVKLLGKDELLTAEQYNEQKVKHEGEITVKGVNSKEELLESIDLIWEDIQELMAKDARS